MFREHLVNVHCVIHITIAIAIGHFEREIDSYRPRQGAVLCVIIEL